MGNLNRLHKIYAKVPKIACKGLCVDSCGPIQMYKIEYKRLGEPPAAITCTLLKDGRCTKYADRPLICRLWGVVPEMPCPWGCEIEGGPIDGAPLMRDLRLISPEVRPTYAELNVVLESYVEEMDRRLTAARGRAYDSRVVGSLPAAMYVTHSAGSTEGTRTTLGPGSPFEGEIIWHL